MTLRYAYYPGCSQEASAEEYNESLKAVARHLERMDLVEMDDWNCCGATPAATVHPLLPHALAARNLAIAEEMGMELVAPCAACYKNMNKASHALDDDPDLLAQINATLDGHQLGQPPRVRHPLDVVVNDVGVENIPVEKPLRGLKVASYYGCLITRPEGGFDDPEYPQSMDRLMEALGAEAVDWAYKTKCCGGAIYMTTEDVSFSMSADILAHAKAAGANAIAAGCPFCQLLLDLYQDKLEAIRDTTFDIPIFFFSQLMGLAMGLDRDELGLDKLVVSPGRLLSETLDAPESDDAKPRRKRPSKPKRWGEA
ncbi:MAG: CoB--CoM heterodisulfide reductase iron-sulfur subunit B family protein [Anaerolineae bacterium]|jgi:heterodisulfide reductase subunit B